MSLGSFLGVREENRSLLYRIYTIFFVSGAMTTVLGAVLPSLSSEYGLSYGVSGMLLSAHQIGNLFAVFIAGILPYAIGRRLSTAILTSGIVLGLLLMTVTGNPFLLFRRTDWIVDWVSDRFGEGYRASRLCGLGFVTYGGYSDMGDAPIHMSPKRSRSKNPEGVRKVTSRKYDSVSLLSGMDLRTGDLLGVLLETQECSDFTEFLKKADRHYDKKLTINIVLGDEAICQTKEILDYLSKQPKQRFKFITSPRCTFLLNLIDTLFGKMASQLLRTARFKSKKDLICHIEEWLVEINRQPLVCYWKSGRTENIERVLLSL